MNIDAILKLIPHRYPFLLIDRVLDLIPEKSIKVLKNVTINEHFFSGHFSDQPRMPSILIPEAMAQSLAILAVKTMQSKNLELADGIFFFGGIDNLNFIHPVIPGDTLIIETELTKFKSILWKCSSKATVENKIVCTAELLAAYKPSNEEQT